MSVNWVFPKRISGEKKEKCTDEIGKRSKIEAREEGGKRLIVVAKRWSGNTEKSSLDERESQIVGGKKIDGQIGKGEGKKAEKDHAIFFENEKIENKQNGIKFHDGNNSESETGEEIFFGDGKAVKQNKA